MSVLGIVNFVLVGIIIIWFSIKANKGTAKLLIILCFFQNIYILLLSRWITSIDYIVLISLKEILVYATIIISFTKKRKIDRVERYSFIGIGVILIYFLLGMNFSMSVIAAVRQLIVPFAFYLFGRSLNLNNKDFFEIINFFIKMSIFAVLFGMVQMVVGLPFFDTLGIENYLMIKYGYIDMYNGYVIRNSMMSYDFIKYTGKAYLRMASILVDPVILSQILALAFAFVVSDSDSKLSVFIHRKLSCVLLFLGTMLTLGKGGIIILIIVSLFVWGKKSKDNKFLSYIIYLLLGMAAIYLLISAQAGSSIDAHLKGVTDIIPIIMKHPFGVGIGEIGNVASLYNENILEVSGESFIGSVMGQMGIVGIIIYVVFILGLLEKYNKLKMYSYLYNIVYIATNAMWITSFLNNTAISFTNCFMYFMVLGFSERVICSYSEHKLHIEDKENMLRGKCDIFEV